MTTWILRRVLNPDVDGYTSMTNNFLLDSTAKPKISIGRGRSNDILLTSLFVSRIHCYITFLCSKGIARIHDNKSENGTFVNGQKLVRGQSMDIRESNTIGIGVDINDSISCWLFKFEKCNDVTPSIDRLGRLRITEPVVPGGSNKQEVSTGTSTVCRSNALAGESRMSTSSPYMAIMKAEKIAHDDKLVICLDSDSEADDDDVVILSDNVRASTSPDNVPSVAPLCNANPHKESCMAASSDKECVTPIDIPPTPLPVAEYHKDSSILVDTMLKTEVDPPIADAKMSALVSMTNVHHLDLETSMDKKVQKDALVNSKSNEQGNGNGRHNLVNGGMVMDSVKNENESEHSLILGSCLDTPGTTSCDTTNRLSTELEVKPRLMSPDSQQVDQITAERTSPVLWGRDTGKSNYTPGTTSCDTTNRLSTELEVKPRLMSPDSQRVDQITAEFTSPVSSGRDTGKSNYTNSDIVEILSDDDEDALFPSSQSVSRGVEEMMDEVCARPFSPNTESTTIVCDDSDDDDDDIVEMWYQKLSQEPAACYKGKVLKEEQEAYNDDCINSIPYVEDNQSASNAGPSKDSGLSSGDKDSELEKGLAKRKNQSSTDDEGGSDSSVIRPQLPKRKKVIESSSEDEELPPSRRRFKRLRSTSEDEELPQSRQLSKPLRSTTQCTLPSDTDSDIDSEVHRSSEDKLSSDSDSDKLFKRSKPVMKRRKLSSSTTVVKHVPDKNYSSSSEEELPDGSKQNNAILQIDKKHEENVATSDSDLEGLLTSVSLVTKPWLHRSGYKNKEKQQQRKAELLINALPMPHRRSHQRGISGTEAVRLFEKNKAERRASVDAVRRKSIEDSRKQTESIKECDALKVGRHLNKETRDHASATPGKQRKANDSAKINQKKKMPSYQTRAAASALEKEQIRKKKLKEIAEKDKAINAEEKAKLLATQNSKKVPSKPAVKVTDKSRANLLALELTSSSNRVAAPNKSKQKPAVAAAPPRPKAQKCNTKTNPTQNYALDYRPLPKQRIPLLKNRPKPPQSTTLQAGDTIPSLPLTSITNTFPKKSCLPACYGYKARPKKTVRFKEDDDLEVFHFFESELNTSRKPVGNSKDVAPPNRVTPVVKSFYDALNFILSWHVTWFQEQQVLAADNVPPVHPNMSLIHMLSQFTSYSDYWKVMIPLMLLNLWACISKENDSGEKEIHHIATKSQVCCKEDSSFTRLHCYTLLPAHSKTKLPSNGDLVVLHVKTQIEPKGSNGEVSTRFIFAYVERVYKERLSLNSVVHRDLVTRIPEARSILNMVVLTKNRSECVMAEFASRMKVVSYIRPALRSFQAIAALCESPLRQFILKPKIEDFTLSNRLQHQEISFLKDCMNKEQYEAVGRTAEACLSKEPKICMIQGPPGTGKSFVIVNIVRAILKCIQKEKNLNERYRILVCAPSNAALDELVRRLLVERGKLPQKERFRLVRTGVTNSSTDLTVKSISLEELVNTDLLAQERKESGNILSSLELEKNSVLSKIHAAEQALAAKRNGADRQQALTKITNYRKRLENLEATNKRKDMRTDPRLRSETEQKILRGANIVASTLTSCVNGVMEAAFMHDENSFGCCIIDEASQCCEPENLLPLLLGIKTLVLVGDPLQLPATTISKVAKEHGFGTSLFARLSECFADCEPSPIHFLKEQYRMHPNILRWPNLRFYSNRLTTASGVKERKVNSLVPYMILQHNFTQESYALCNQEEAILVNTLVNCILERQTVKVAVITPYNKQCEALKFLVRRPGVTISTIDAFQGKESDVVIMSCVRTDGTGFMGDEQRLNVALTRAKQCLIICANFHSLKANQTWRSLYDDGKNRKVLEIITSDASRNAVVLSRMIHQRK